MPLGLYAKRATDKINLILSTKKYVRLVTKFRDEDFGMLFFYRGFNSRILLLTLNTAVYRDFMEP